jgi:hypothetical protein
MTNPNEEDDQDMTAPQMAPLAMGTREREDGSGRVGFIRFGEYDCEVDAEQADDMSASLREIAIELRNGGRLS